MNEQETTLQGSHLKKLLYDIATRIKKKPQKQNIERKNKGNKKENAKNLPLLVFYAKFCRS